MSKREPVSLGELCDLVGGRLIGDPAVQVTGAAAPGDAGPNDVTFVSHLRFAAELPKTRAACLVASTAFAATRADELPCAVLACDPVELGFAQVLTRLYPARQGPVHIDDRAVVHVEARLASGVRVDPFAVVGRARIGAGTAIGAGCVVEDDVVIGTDCELQPGVVVLRGSTLQDRVIVQPGVVIGADGYGYAADGDHNVKVPQVGGVVIESDVELGANSCVDRGALRDTAIGQGTKVDNLVQVGHGARIGQHAVVIAQTGIGGDADIGDRAVLCGQVGLVHNVVVGDDARVGAKSGVTADVPRAGAVSGIPAYAHAAWLRSSVRIRELDGLYRRVASTERDLAEARAAIAALQEELASLRSGPSIDHTKETSDA